MSHAHPRSRGFTLIELLVVLAILGIATLAVVSFRVDRQTRAVKTVLKDLSGFLQDARNQARNGGETLFLVSENAGPSAALRFGTYPLDKDGALDFTKPMQVRGSFTLDRQHGIYANLDQNRNLYDVADPHPDIVGEKIDGVWYVPEGAKCMLPAAPGTADTRFSFLPNGDVNRSFYVAIVGLRAGVAYQDAPIGVVAAGPGVGLRAYYRTSSSSAPWSLVP